MNQQIDVSISVLDERFFSALEHPEGLFPILAVKAEEIVGALVSELEQYPPETEANSPGRYSMRSHKPMGFYERGRGWWYPIMTKGAISGAGSRVVSPGQSVSGMRIKTMAMRTRGKGAAMVGASGYRLKPTSEQLGENWVSIVEESPEDVVMTVGNPVSYAGYVQGYQQSRQMDIYEWQTIEDVLRSPFFREVAAKREDEAIDSYYHLYYGLGAG